MSPEPGSDVRRLAVCLCTYKRPPVLARLLESIERCRAEVQPGVSVGVVVVDDDPAESAREVATGATSRFDFLEYSVTGSGDISAARNRALEVGLSRGDLLALIDDDCTPEPAWLRSLLEVHLETAADIVSGACDTTFPPSAPAWLRDEPFTDARWTIPDRSASNPGYVKNLLVTAEFLQRTGLRFDPDYGKSSGEDALFLYGAQQHGARSYFAADAVVWEDLPAQRIGLRYQLRRRFWYGSTEAVTSIASGQATRGRVALRGIKQVAVGVTRPLARMLRLRRPQVRFGIGEVLRGAGLLLGAAGIRMSHR